MIKDGLSVITQNISNVHIGLAVEYLYEARKDKRWNKQAFSSIIHGFIGLESYVNFLGHEMLFNKDSHIYWPINREDFATIKLLNTWDYR